MRVCLSRRLYRPLRPRWREPDRSPPSTAPTKLYPIYVTTYHGRRSPSVRPRWGPAAAAQLLDWLISYGVREIISAGSCGVLTPFDEGTFLVPCKALRDEGASYHYAPPSRYMEISEPARRASSKPSSPTICAIRRSSHRRLLP